METANRLFLANATEVRTAGQHIRILFHIYPQKGGGKKMVEVGSPNKSLDPFPSLQLGPFLSRTQNPSKE